MKELDVVRLKKEYNGISAGTEDTIVMEYDGTHFEVELMIMKTFRTEEIL